MRVLLDTHAVLWWLAGDERMPARARAVVADNANDILVSAVTVWEIATKLRIGKLPGAERALDAIDERYLSGAFTPLAITPRHARRAGSLPGPHKDPFDRMLIAQAIGEDVPIVTIESLFDTYGVVRIW
jgi:PIN domain nuclease of toxin-antitoxin system